MSYFLPFFSGLVAASGFLGLPFGQPTEGALRITSRADLSYKDSFVIGFIPALKRRNFAVLRLIFRIAAISETVYPSILILSEYNRKNLQKIVQKLQYTIQIYSMFEKKVKKVAKKLLFLLTYSSFLTTI